MRSFLFCFQIIQSQTCLGLKTVKVEFQTIAIENTNYIRDQVYIHEACSGDQTIAEDLQADTFVGCAKAASEGRESFLYIRFTILVSLPSFSIRLFKTLANSKYLRPIIAYTIRN